MGNRTYSTLKHFKRQCGKYQSKMQADTQIDPHSVYLTKKSSAETDFVSNENGAKRRKIRIRHLVQPAKAPHKKSTNRVKIIGFSIVFACFVAILWKNHLFRDSLKHLAMNQFQQYLHGRENYCNEPFEHWLISNAMRYRIIGQEIALTEIESTLQLHDNFTALAFVGSQGIGKTLTLNIIQDHFQWHLNIQQYIWSLIQSPDRQLRYLLQLIDGLSTYGQNGVFVDNIPISNIDIINTFHQKLLSYAKENHIKVIAIYVFQTDSAEAADLIQIDNVTSILFRQFNLDDVRNCINVESDRMKIKITSAQIEELLMGVDFRRNGCKLVAAKIARQAEDFS